MVADNIFKHIPTDRPEFEMTVEEWNDLIMNAGIQNVISSAVLITGREFRQLKKTFFGIIVLFAVR